jgi:hypothetical protein
MKRAVVLGLLLLWVGVALAVKDCPACGTDNRDDAKFCKSCGTKLPEPEPRNVPSAPRMRADVTVGGGVVSITSEPSGAVVEIDGTERGRTPLDVTGLGSGRHSVTVSRPGYRDYSSFFVIAVQAGTVVVTTEPVGAQVWVDGEFKGSTTATGLAVSRLAFGTRRIVARMAGHAEAARDVELNSAGPIAVNIRLGAGKGFLSVRSDPQGAEVTANGRRIGATDTIVELLPSRYVLMMTRRGYQDWVGYADVVLAETALVSEKLERLRTRKLPFLIGGAALLAGGGVCEFLAEQKYAAYRGARNQADALRLRESTQAWDTRRNIALGAGAAMVGVYFVVRW